MSETNGHIRFEILTDLATGHLPDDQVNAVRSHLRGCSHCRNDFDWIKSTINLMQSDDTHDAPQHTIAGALSAFQPAPAPVEQAGVFNRLLARLQFDSAGMNPSLAGLRGAPAGPRQMLYATDDIDVDLRLDSVGDLWELTGQLLGDCAGGEVHLSGGHGEYRAEMDDMCEFHVSGIRPGLYALVIRFGSTEIEVSDLRFGEDSGSS